MVDQKIRSREALVQRAKDLLAAHDGGLSTIAVKNMLLVLRMNVSRDLADQLVHDGLCRATEDAADELGISLTGVGSEA